MTLDNSPDNNLSFPGDTSSDTVHTPETQGTGTRQAINWESLALLLLIPILLLAAYFRFTGLNWDETFHLHPDERFLTIVATQLETTNNPIEYLRTSTSPLNPYNRGQGFYVYGNFPMMVTRYVAEWANDFCQIANVGCEYNFAAYDGVHLVGRALSALVDLISVVLTFMIGRRLYDWRVGLLGALLLGVAVMPIQQSHFFTMDNWAAALVTFSMYAAVRASQDARRWRWWLLFGVGLGLAAASRINVAPVAGMAPVAAAMWLARGAALSDQRGISFLLSTSGKIRVQTAIMGVVVAAMLSIVTFRLAQPYAFMDRALARQTVLMETGVPPGFFQEILLSLVGLNPQFTQNMGEIQGQQSPEASFPPALQWTDRAPILFPLTNMVLYGMGLSAGIAAWLGFLWALWRIARARPDWMAHALPVIWTGFYFLFMGTRWVKSIRYFLPIYPFLLLLAAWALIHLWDRNRGKASGRLLVAGAIFLTVIPAALWANTFVQTYQQPITRVEASSWMYENIPTAVTLIYEHGRDAEIHEVQLPLRSVDIPPGGVPIQLNFSLPLGGELTGIRFNYLSDAAGGQGSGQFQVKFSTAGGSTQVLTEAEIDFEVGADEKAVVTSLPRAILAPEQLYTLRLENTGDRSVHLATSVIANEHWDDALPVRMDGRDPYSQYYNGVSLGQIPVATPGDENKRGMMLDWLEESDVLVLSSQRSLWNTPRLPLTYPLNIEYYESLFNGDLGFELAAQFHANYNIGPLYISDTTGQISLFEPPDVGWPPPGDLAAEEAFSVYDHPPVWIFVKSQDYSQARAEAILGAVDLSQQMFMTPGQATQAKNGLLLEDEVFQAQQEAGTFAEIFDPDSLLNQSPALAAVVWWLALILLGWLIFPIAFVAFPGLRDRGYALSKILALLFISYIGWLLSSLDILPNSRGTLLLAALGLGLISLVITLRYRTIFASFVQHHRRYLILVEVVSLLLFVFWLGIRLGNPDVWDVIYGGEKPMDLSYFTAVLKSTTFPPYDPWYAGGYINYYYYGFVYVGSITKLLGIVPTLAYNLILPMLYSFTGIGAFSIAYNLVARRNESILQPVTDSLRNWLKSKAIVAGFAAIALAVVLGNLAQPGVILSAWERSSDSPSNNALVRVVDGALDVILTERRAAVPTGDWFWSASRAISVPPNDVQPITEFPYFTFLYGDLHAHMIAMPLMLLALGWAVSTALAGAGPKRRRWHTVMQWIVGALAIGVLRATNTWDLPTYLVLGTLAITFAAYQRQRKLSLSMFGTAAVEAAILIGLALLAFQPFAAHYGSGYASISLWPGPYTSVIDYLSHYGLFMFLTLGLILWELRSWGREWTVEGMSRQSGLLGWIIVSLVAFLLLAIALMVRGYWIGPIVMLWIVSAGLLSLRPGMPPLRRIVLALISASFALTLAVEIIVLDGDIARMNTVFKFYVQVWLLLSVAGGVAFARAISSLRARSGMLPTAWRTAIAVMVIAALLYPILATWARWEIRMSDDAPLTLDGMAFMEVTSYNDGGEVVSLNPDYQALMWMQRNVEGTPVVAEANDRTAYRSIGNRVSMYTGLPTIVGWDWHQRQQRAVLPGSLVERRIADITQLYNTPFAEEAMPIIEKYDVEYVYVGPLEKLNYSPGGILKFENMVNDGLLEPVYNQLGVTIYRVMPPES